MTIINRSSITLALLTRILVVGGVIARFPQAISLFPNAYAHTFTPDDSASFLALIYRIKNEAELVQDNLLGNTSTTSSNVLAEQHAKNAISILNETWTKEIAERNRRIAGEINAALSELHDTVTVLIQNGKQIVRIPSITQVGMNVPHYVFSNSGPTSIRIENIGGYKSSFTDFGTTVYDNPAISSEAVSKIAAQRNTANNPSNILFRISPLTLVYIAYAVIFGIPAAVGVTYFLYRKGII